MSFLDAQGIYSQFKVIEQRLGTIRTLYGAAKELGEVTGEDAKFTQVAYELLDDVKEFVKLIEESDTNLDLETTKLEGVDKFFEGHEATAFVNNALHEVYNGLDSQQQYGENEIHDHLFEGLCWCQFKRKLKRMNLTVDNAPISAYMLSMIEATRDFNGECFHCSNAEDRPCGPECTDPCPCFDK